jgi:hypothetical protein
MFLVVTDEMLETCNDILLLDAIAICTSECAREQWILRVRFETSATKRTPLNVDCRSKDDMSTFGFRLVGKQVANAMD